RHDSGLRTHTPFETAHHPARTPVDTNLAAARVGRAQVAQRATFTVDAFPGRIFRGEVVQIRKAAQVLQNVVTYDVVVSAPNIELILLPTMTANVRVVTDQKESVLQVPNAALRFRPPGAENERQGGGGRGPGAGGPGQGGARGAPRGRVWVVGENGKPAPIPVQLGISDGANTEVA